MRAVLFASATATSLNGLRDISPASQTGSFTPRLPSLMIEVAPTTRSVLSCWLPRLEIAPSRSLPPLECALGVSPIHAAKSRPVLKL